MKLASYLASLRKTLPFFGKDDAYLCLDLGSHSIKLLEVHGLDRPKVLRGGLARLGDSQHGSSVMQNPEAVLEAIKDLKARLSPTATRVLTSVPGPSAIIKKLTLPKTAELDQAIENEASRLIPESLDLVQWDYEVLQTVRGEKTEGVEVLLAAVKREVIERTIEVLGEVGWEPVIMDVDYFALENLFEALHPNRQGVVALLSVGDRATLIDIMKNGRSAFRGDLSVGGREFTEAIMEEGRISFEEGETVKTRAWERGSIPPEFTFALESAVENLIQEVKRSLSLYWTFAMEEQVSSIYLCGGGSMIPGLSSRMIKGLGVPVEVLDPLKAMTVEESLATDFHSLSPLLAIGAGLSLRRPNEQ